MELWIRSKDRERLINTSYIEIQHHYSYKNAQEKYLLPNGSYEWRNVTKKDKYVKSVLFGNNEILLGTYNSKKRALEVLNDIEDKLINCIFAKKQNGLGEVLDFMPNSIYVYEMPKE